MIARMIWPLILTAGAAQAATLPIKAGTYVRAGTPCADPPLAATFDYDGRIFSYPHATQCRSTITAHAGHVYHVRETCSAQGDGSATAPSTMSTVYRIVSHERIAVRHGKDDAAYRWCPATRPHQG